MSGSVLGDDPLETARALQGALEGMTVQLAQVKTSVRRGKRVIAALVVSLILDVALTVGVSIAAVQATNASAQANTTVTKLHSTQVNACRAGNQTRAEEIALWMHIASLPVTTKRTPQELKAEKQLLAYIRHTFRSRNCVAIYKLR